MFRPLATIKRLPLLFSSMAAALRDERTRRRLRKAVIWLFPILPIFAVAIVVYLFFENTGRGDPAIASASASILLVAAVAIWRLRRKLPWLFSAILVVAASHMLANQILTGAPVQAVLVIVSFILAAIMVARLDVAVLVMMVTSATVIYPTALPSPITIGGGGFGSGELLLIFMVFVGFVKAYKNRRHVSSPLTPAVLCLFLAVLLALVVGYRVYLANPRGFYLFEHAYNAARGMFRYLGFFAILYGIKDKKEYRFVFNATLFLACVVSAVVVAQYFLGRHVQLFLGSPEGFIGRVEGEQDVSVTRLSPPGVPLMLLMLTTCLYLASAYKGKVAVRYGVLTAILAAGVILTFSRTSWISIGLAVLLILVLSPMDVKGRALATMGYMAAAAVVASIALAIAVPGRAEPLQRALVNRVESVLHSRKTYDTTGAYRRNESRRVLKLALQHPIFGIGLGETLDYDFLRQPGPNGRLQEFQVPKRTIHNSYINIWAQYGVLGLIAFGWISVVFIYRGLALWRRADELWIRGIGLCFVLTYIGLLVRSLAAMTLLGQLWEIAVTCYMWGMVEVGHMVAVRNPTSQIQLDVLDGAVRTPAHAE